MQTATHQLRKHTMKNLGENQIKVLEAAKQKIGMEVWFRGICIDNFPSEQDCIEDFDGEVSGVVCETMYWDAPNHGL